METTSGLIPLNRSTPRPSHLLSLTRLNPPAPQHGFFAVHDTVAEVDLNTLQVVSRRQFSFPVSCISAAEPLLPLTVGTTHTMHLFGVYTIYNF